MPSIRIVVCAKEVPDPDAVNSYAVAGRLEIGDDGKTLTQTAIPRLMNAYDEQAIEAALRLRDAGAECRIDVVTAGRDAASLLRHAAALGADEIAAIDVDASAIDYHVAARLLAAYIETTGGADLVLCGRQASDDDQGVVPALIGERLGMPLITVARDVQLADGSAVRVTRVTPDGDEVVEAACPAVVTVSSELGPPRYPTARQTMAARKKQATVLSPGELGVGDEEMAPRVELVRQFVPEIHGNCEMVTGETAVEQAANLIAAFRESGVLS